MTVMRSARERARAEIRGEILDEAGRQLAAGGAEQLSVRAVARALGMVSSAVYRYFAGRDELLTALIVQSYDDLGSRAETAARGPGGPAERFVATSVAVRAWAVEHPHRYGLLYGTPVLGYEAPPDTVDPGVRVPLALFAIVLDAWRAGQIDVREIGAGEPPVGPALAPGLEVLRQELHTRLGDGATGTPVAEMPLALLRAALSAWTQLFGMISFELFGQLRGIVEDGEAFVAELAAVNAARCGLGAAATGRRGARRATAG